jgi:cell division protein FtsW (lipid II flippase)
VKTYPLRLPLEFCILLFPCFCAAQTGRKTASARNLQAIRPGTLTIIVVVIGLLNPILGTVFGIYTLWVLLPADAEAEWRRAACVTWCGLFYEPP